MSALISEEVIKKLTEHWQQQDRDGQVRHGLGSIAQDNFHTGRRRLGSVSIS
jgi:hypothetical protein